MSAPTEASSHHRLESRQTVSRMIGAVVAFSILIAILVELSIRIGVGSEGVPEWVAPFRIIPWLMFFLTATGWVLHNTMPATATTKKTVRPAQPIASAPTPAPAPTEKPKEEASKDAPPLPLHVVGPCIIGADPVIGRNRDRERLTDWIRGGASSVLVVHSRAGMGKSSLLWLWMQQDVRRERLDGQPVDGRSSQAACQVPDARRPQGVFWYSFEEAGTSFLMMLDQLVEFLAAGREVPALQGTRAAKLDFVVDELAQRSVLVILDGFDMILAGCNTTLAHYQSDRLSALNEPADRRCADPLAAEFLNRISRVRRAGRVIVISRHVPLECESEGEAHGGADLFELDGLDPSDALLWLDRVGSTGDRARQHVMIRICQGRPLALKLAIGLARSDSVSPGDVGVVVDHPLISRSQSPHQVIKAAVSSLDRSLRDLLGRIAAVRGTVSRDMVEHISPIGKGSVLDQSLETLAGRGLVLIGENKTYAIHSLVRAAAYERLTDAPAVHAALEAKLAGGTLDAARLDRLRPAIERFHHMAASGRLDQAREFLRDTLYRLIASKHGDFTLMTTLARSLFSSGTGNAPVMDKPSANAATVRMTAELLRVLGEPEESAAVAQLAIDRAHAWKTRQTVDIDLLQQAECWLTLGQLRQAGETGDECVLNCQSQGEELRWAMAREFRARLALIEDRVDDAEEESESALKATRRLRSPAELAQCLATRAEVLLERHELAEALSHAEEALRTAQPTTADMESLPFAAIRVERILARCLTASAEAHANASEREQIASQAQDRINAGLRQCWRRNILILEPELRLARAANYLVRRQPDRALVEAETALRQARRFHAKLLQIDAQILIAKILQLSGKAEAAQIHRDEARELAWCDGPPHCYKTALEIVAVS